MRRSLSWLPSHFLSFSFTLCWRRQTGFAEREYKGSIPFTRSAHWRSCFRCRFHRLVATRIAGVTHPVGVAITALFGGPDGTGNRIYRQGQAFAGNFRLR